MSKSPIILVGALVAGLVGGFTLRDTTTLPIADASTDAQDWKPRNTIQRDIGMSAEELDGQQPDAGIMGSRPASASRSASGRAVHHQLFQPRR
ncbi:hypothetical protein [Sphingobium sp. KCTC 72723]|uniref:hypothetical protein n=1 Tax=Sphingobium sp. KCTC 72723 TaxID=2733867 RepID=UPI00165E5CAA|nr:hypothetical protein [Sphingobium sp. KCTC 72723]